MEVENISVPEIRQDFKTIKKNPLNITNEERKSLILFREAIQKIENLYCPMDDEFLIKFLRAKNCNINKSVAMIKLYYEAKEDNKHLINIQSDRIKKIYEKGGIMLLKNRDNGKHVLYLRIAGYEPYEFTEDEYAVAIGLVIEEMIQLEETQKNGCCFIADYEGFTFAHARASLANFSIKRMKMAIKILQGGYPIKIKSGVAINFPYALQGMWKLVKPLFKEKLRNRIFVTRSGFKALHQQIDLSILPVTLGGPLALEDAIDVEIFDKLLSKEKYYRDMFDYGFKH